MAGGSGMKVAPGMTRREAQLALARKGREQAKRKLPPTTGSGSKKPKTIPLREPSSMGGDQSGIVGSKKAKTPSGTPTKSGDPQKVVSLMKTSPSEAIPAKPLQSFSLEGATKKKDKGKAHQTEATGAETEKEDFLTVNFKLPSDFLLDGELDRGKIFHAMQNFLLPTFRAQYQDVPVDETGSHAAGLSFLALQANLNLYSRMDEIWKAIPRAVEKIRKTENELLRAREEGKEDKAKVEELTVRLDDVKNNLEVTQAKKEELKTCLKESRERVYAAEAYATATKASLDGRDQTIQELKNLVFLASILSPGSWSCAR